MTPPPSSVPPERRSALQHNTGASGLAAAGLDPRRFGLLCVLAYIALAWAVRFDMRMGGQMASLVYPLDTFSMYAGAAGEYVAYPLIRDRDGQVHRITRFRTFDCAAPVARPAARCGESPGFAYLYDDMASYIDHHRGAGASDVDLVYRTWHVRAGQAPEIVADCVIAHCKVSQ